MPTPVIHFDAQFESLDQLHDALQTQLDLPGFYGRNLDALRDCLTGHIETPLVLVWHDFELLRTAFGDPISQLKDVLEAAQAENPGITVVFK